MGNTIDENEDEKAINESLEFVNAAKVRWIQNGKFLVITDYITDKGNSIAVTIQLDMLTKALDKSDN